MFEKSRVIRSQGLLIRMVYCTENGQYCLKCIVQTFITIYYDYVEAIRKFCSETLLSLVSMCSKASAVLYRLDSQCGHGVLVTLVPHHQIMFQW